jgi:hypothetical protein
LSPAPTLRVEHVRAFEELVSVDPGINDVTVTAVSLRSLRSASAKACTKE